MKELLFILAVTVYVAAVQSVRDPCICTREYVPVCGSNGKTYGNECEFNCAKQTENHDLEIVQHGECDSPDIFKDPCMCTREYRPVCGSDGKTYANKCTLNCAKVTKNHELEIEHEGHCATEQLFNNPCICTREYMPVCGSDGKTYSNKCTFNCAKVTKNHDLEIEHIGHCTTKQHFTDPCICTREYMPVCGTDGHTYGNKCTFNCAKVTKNHELEIANEGECQNEEVALERDPCICTREYMPVCGSDGKTYSNKCEFNCAKVNENHELEIEHVGHCATEQLFRNPCICTREYMPVCGSDGKTYSNKCTFNCAKVTKNHDLEIEHIGHCTTEQHFQDPCACTREYMPVCGTDGHTYGNKCTFNCAKVTKNNELEIAYKGECQNEEVAVEQKPCICPYIWSPLCGTDGQTYPNDCVLKCGNKDGNKHIEVAYRGICEKKPKSNGPCICTMEYNPICGSDGHTYGNPCELNCAAKNDASLTAVKHGRCEEQEMHVSNRPCICTMEYNPICGSDGNTYGNPCELNCAAKNDASLTAVKHGQCEEQDKYIEACTLEWAPICGSDGHTYGNLCFFKSAAKHNDLLKVAHQGPCHTKIIQEDERSFCTTEWAPICGSDGHTYSNKCFFGVATRENKELTMAHKGSCETPQLAEEHLCACTDDYRPVCGSDGRTYPNLCGLNCEAKNKPGLKLLYPSVCVIM